MNSLITCAHNDVTHRFSMWPNYLNMALYKYFKKTSIFQNPNGPLSAWIPSSAIAKANEEVESLLTESTSKKGGK